MLPEQCARQCEGWVTLVTPLTIPTTVLISTSNQRERQLRGVRQLAQGHTAKDLWNQDFVQIVLILEPGAITDTPLRTHVTLTGTYEYFEVFSLPRIIA